MKIPALYQYDYMFSIYIYSPIQFVVNISGFDVQSVPRKQSPCDLFHMANVIAVCI